MSKKSRGKIKKKALILGINVDIITRDEAVEVAFDLAATGKGKSRKALIVTPNPEIVVAAQQDASLAKILNRAELSLADGIGLVAAAKFLSLKSPKNPLIRLFYLTAAGLRTGWAVLFDRKFLDVLPEPVPGRVLMRDLSAESARRGLKVFILGGKPGVAQKAAAKMRQSFPRLNIASHSGPWLNQLGRPTSKADEKKEKEAVAAVNRFAPDLLFVGFGPPKQEKWLARNLSRLEVGAAMTVGGAFDYLASGQPPDFLARAGVEWLWRLARQPWRAKRVATAVLVFPLQVYLWRLKNG